MATRLCSRLGVGLLLMVSAAGRAPAQCPNGTLPPCEGQTVRTPASRSIAVLTFENTTRDTSAQYLAEGLADQITTRLGGVSRLTMISRTGVRRLHSPEQLSVQQLGRALNAAYLVSGSIRAAGGRVRVNVEALRAATGEVVWSDAFDRAGDDLIGIEEAVAMEVAAGVGGRLSPRERRVLGGRVTASSPAYAQFLRGNVLLARRSVATLQAAMAAYLAAIAADSGFADAYARLGYAYALCVSWRCADAESLLALSRRASARALQLDPRSSDAWLGWAYRLTAWSFGGRVGGDDSLLASLAAFRRAVELNPRNDEAWHQYGSALKWVSDSASLDALRRALALDPARAITYADLGGTYLAMGRMDRVIAVFDTALSFEPDATFRNFRVLARLLAGDTAGALADARQVPRAFFAREVLAAFAHDTASIRLVEADTASPHCEQGESAMYLLWTGQRERAIQELLRCRPSLLIRSVLRVPAFSPIASDPRILALRAAAESILARARWR